MIRVYTSVTDKPSEQELHSLFRQTKWAADRSADDIEALLARLDVFVCVRNEGGQLAGFGRALSDGMYRALLDDIIVDSAARGMGLGDIIVSSLLKQLGSVEQVFLNTEERLTTFYAKHGFQLFSGQTMLLKKAPERVVC